MCFELHLVPRIIPMWRFPHCFTFSWVDYATALPVILGRSAENSTSAKLDRTWPKLGHNRVRNMRPSSLPMGFRRRTFIASAVKMCFIRTNRCFSSCGLGPCAHEYEFHANHPKYGRQGVHVRCAFQIPKGL